MGRPSSSKLLRINGVASTRLKENLRPMKSDAFFPFYWDYRLNMIKRSMKYLIVIIGVSVFLIVFGLGPKTWFSPYSSGEVVLNQSNISMGVHEAIFERDLFDKGVESLNRDNVLDKKLSGGVVPHHLLPSYIIVDFFYKLSLQKPKTIILIGPNHFEAGDFLFTGSEFSWNTSFGVVSADLDKVNLLKSMDDFGIDEGVMEMEHGVSGLMPYIRYLMNDVKVVPIAVSNYTKIEDIEKFADYLSNILDDDTVLVASLDFSHYLSFDEAEKNDVETLNMIESLDYDRILKLNNDFVDSPVVLAVFLKTMEKSGSKNIAIFNHDNSGNILGNPWVETTSYYSLGVY